MRKTYHVTKIHQEVVGYLMQHKGIIRTISDVKDVRRTISFRPNKEAPISREEVIDYLRNQDFPFYATSEVEDADLFNAVCIREFINLHNDWALSSFVKDAFYSKAVGAVGRAFHQKELRPKLKYIIDDMYIRNEILSEAGRDNLKELLNTEFLKESVHCARRRAEVLRVCNIKVPFETWDEYVLFDCCYDLDIVFRDVIFYFYNPYEFVEGESLLEQICPR
jgi:hypothetical protein